MFMNDGETRNVHRRPLCQRRIEGLTLEHLNRDIMSVDVYLAD